MARVKRNAAVLRTASADKTRASLAQNPRPRQKGARLRPTADTHSLALCTVECSTANTKQLDDGEDADLGGERQPASRAVQAEGRHAQSRMLRAEREAATSPSRANVQRLRSALAATLASREGFFFHMFR